MALTLDSGTEAILVSLIPVTILLVWSFARGHKNRKNMYFALGFITVTLFYIVSPDPSTLNALYISQGDYIFPLEVSLISGVLLVIAYTFFRKNLE